MSKVGIVFEISFILFSRRYKDYQDRSECRKLTWQHEEWSEIVTETGELVTSMKSGILVPIEIE